MSKVRKEGAGHTFRGSRIPPRPRWPFECATDLASTVCEAAPGTWVPAKPIAGGTITLRARIVAAWAVLRGRAAAVEWWNGQMGSYDGPRRDPQGDVT